MAVRSNAMGLLSRLPRNVLASRKAWEGWGGIGFECPAKHTIGSACDQLAGDQRPEYTGSSTECLFRPSVFQ